MTRAEYRFKTIHRTMKAGEAFDLGNGMGLVRYIGSGRIEIVAPENAVKFLPVMDEPPEPEPTVQFRSTRQIVEETEPTKLPAA